MNRCNGCDAQSGAEKDTASFEIVVTVSVKHADALWTAAMRTLRGFPDLTSDDIIESIGPREDPSIEDCLKTLVLRAGLEGCGIGTIDVNHARHEHYGLSQHGHGTNSTSMTIGHYV